MQQLVPPQLLASADKILFVSHLALGDFTYMQNYFAVFAKQYPHIKIHLWVDEVRRSRCFWRWNGLKKYSLYDWLEACQFIHKVYKDTYSPSVFDASVNEAIREKYSLVVSLAIIRTPFYAALSRRISPHGFIVGIQQPMKPWNFIKRWKLKKFDAGILRVKNYQGVDIHISDVYAQWFESFFGLKVLKEDRRPFVSVPRKWITFAKLRFLKWGIDKKSKEFGRVFFINAYAKNRKRSWPIENVLKLVTTLKQQDQWGDVSFIVNVIPEEFDRVRAFFNKHSINNLYLFTADYNFFQLPAVISICDMVISVETSTMHFASALKVPIVALMRAKNPEWVPWDKERSFVIFAEKADYWVNSIKIEPVLAGIEELARKFLCDFTQKNSEKTEKFIEIAQNDLFLQKQQHYSI